MLFVENFEELINLNAKVGKISWISRISEFCSNVFKVLTRNPLSFSSPDSCLTLSKAWKRVNKAVFQKWSFPKVTERRIFEFLAILNSAKLAKPLKKAVFQKWSLSEETERRIFSHSGHEKVSFFWFITEIAKQNFWKQVKLFKKLSNWAGNC